jgi:hypothetical protein
MVTEQLSIEDAPELRTENVVRIAADERERVTGWCRENLKGAWQLVRRRFSGEDQEAVKDAAEPLVYRFEIWELRIDDPEEAASARLALT